jgi:hypothetical protein
VSRTVPCEAIPNGHAVAPFRDGIHCSPSKLDPVKIHGHEEEAELRQLTLFGTEPRPLPREGGGADRHWELTDRHEDFSEAATGQIDLFAEHAGLARDLDGALRR